jgi:hypothetical protein
MKLLVLGTQNGNLGQWVNHHEGRILMKGKAFIKDLPFSFHHRKKQKECTIHLIYCKNFCKCHKGPLPSTTIKKKKDSKKWSSTSQVEGTQKKSNPVNDTQISDLYLPELRENKFLFLKKKKKKK